MPLLRLKITGESPLFSAWMCKLEPFCDALLMTPPTRRQARGIPCWAEAPIKIARMTLTIKLDGNWSSFQLANSTPPQSVIDRAIAPSARIPFQDRSEGRPITVLGALHFYRDYREKQLRSLSRTYASTQSVKVINTALVRRPTSAPSLQADVYDSSS